MQINTNIKFIMAIHDGEAAGSSDGNGAEGTAVSATENGDNTNTVAKETVQRARNLGLSDDLIDSYNAAFGSGKSEDNLNDNADNSNQTQDESNGNELDKEFEEAIKGKYKTQYQAKMKTAVLDRVHQRDEQLAQQQAKLSKANEILELLANKYPGVKFDDYDGLFEAVRKDNSVFDQVAIDKGISAEDALKAFDEQKERQAQQRELESLRAEKTRNELDKRFRGLAVQTQAEYPDFNLEEEFNNPNFRSALDYIAAQKTAANKANGKNDEIFDLTKAYEMAHWDELRSGVVQRSAKAAMSAVSQSIATGAKRPSENAVSKAPPVQSKSFADMDIHSKEFEQFMTDVKAGRRKI